VRKANLLRASACASLSLALAQPAFAQAAEQESEEPAQQIVVTGTYLGGQKENGALPVDVFGTAELEQRGVDSPLDFIKQLPSVGPVLGDSNQYAAGGSQGVGSINLRSLGRERTLVLFNGRRWAPEPGDGAGDTNLIPMFALERIEVLKDGAATTYGSDAIAGVANFVTRRGFEGIEIAGDYQFVSGSDGNYKGSVLLGQNFGAANIMVGVGYQHRSELATTERDFTQVPYAVNPSGWSFLNNPGSFLPRLNSTPLAGVTMDGARINACAALGGIVGQFPSGTSVFPVCRWSYVPFVNLIEEENRIQVYGQLTVDLDDTTKFTAEAVWAQSEVPELAHSPSYPPTSGPTGPGSTSRFTVPSTNPGFASFLAQTFPTGSPAFLANNASITFWRAFGSGGSPLDPRGSGEGGAKSGAWRVAGGFDKDFSENFKAHLFGTYLSSSRRAYSIDIVGTRLQSALNGLGGPACTGTTPGANGCLWFNPFSNASAGNAALGLANPGYNAAAANSEAVIDWLRQENGTKAYEDVAVVDLVFNGDTEIGAMPFAYAFGAQYRWSNFVSRPLNKFSDRDAFPCPQENVTTCATPTGAFIFLGQYPNVNVSQNIKAVFAEARIEPFDGAEIIGAVRYEDYGNPVGSTFNPKLTARWQVADFLALRGSVGTTFRGPLPGDLQGSFSAVAGIVAAGNAFKSTDTFGNPDLEPETAMTWSVGAILEGGGFTFSVDYWTYDFAGRFTTLPVQAIASAAAPGTSGTQFVNCASPFVPFLTFQGGACVQGTTRANDIARVRTQTVNGPDVLTRGIDLGLNYRGDLGGVRLNFGANATHVLEYSFSDFNYNGLLFSTGYEAAGFTNYDRAPGTVSRWRANAYLNAKAGPVSLTWNYTYIGGVTDNRCPAAAPCTTTPEFGGTEFGRVVKAYQQHDLLASIDIPVAGVDFQLQAGVENLFDRAPSAARLEYSYDPFIGSALGRTFKLGGRIKF